MIRSLSSTRIRGRALAIGAVALAAAFIAVGFVGVDRYGRNYWLYRGFPPPTDPGFVTQAGRQERIDVQSAALGGRHQEVYVYLPPGYDASPAKRYPVVYLLHGFPGRPLAFLLTVRAGVVDDVMVAQGEGQPVILVMPFGSTGTFSDKEWANGVRPNEDWATFVARDVVQEVDRRYRTIPDASARAIGGLSEGGYGAINIALQHPREFGVVESWSGYERAARIQSIFGKDLASADANSPLATLGRRARALRAAGTYFWFYSGLDDPLQRQNAAFAKKLARARIPYTYLQLPGGHNWTLWRGYAEQALVAAATRLSHG